MGNRTVISLVTRVVPLCLRFGNRASSSSWGMVLKCCDSIAVCLELVLVKSSVNIYMGNEYFSFAVIPMMCILSACF